MISDSSFHGVDVRFRTFITKVDTLAYHDLTSLYRSFTKRGRDTTKIQYSPRRHGDAEKSSGGKTKSKANTKPKPENSREHKELLKKIARRGRAAIKPLHFNTAWREPKPKSNIHHGDTETRRPEKSRGEAKSKANTKPKNQTKTREQPRRQRKFTDEWRSMKIFAKRGDFKG